MARTRCAVRAVSSARFSSASAATVSWMLSSAATSASATACSNRRDRVTQTYLRNKDSTLISADNLTAPHTANCHRTEYEGDLMRCYSALIVLSSKRRPLIGTKRS